MNASHQIHNARDPHNDVEDNDFTEGGRNHEKSTSTVGMVIKIGITTHMGTS